MDKLINEIKKASEELVNKYNVKDITIYIDEDLSVNKEIRIDRKSVV